MASLVSPGVSVTVTNNSFFIPSTAPTVPLIFLATGANKVQTDGITAAAGTYEYNVIRPISSLTQSLQMYGIPNFLTDASGNSYYGDARNEYGLFALNQYLGIGNLAYVIRANVNLTDTVSSIQNLWSTQINQSAYTVANLISSYLNQVNAANGVTVTQPGFQIAVTGSQLLSLLNQSLLPTFQVSSFTNVASSFVSDSSFNPIPVYANGLTQLTTGSYIGVQGIINAVVDSYTGSQVYTGSTATSGMIGFTAQQAVSLLTTAANNYMYTSIFAQLTSIGSNDASRRAAIVTALAGAINSNTDILSEQYQYNIVVCPGYFEVAPDITNLIMNINNQAFGIMDTPFDMTPEEISSWSNTPSRAVSTSIAYYYPHALAANINGVQVMCAASGVALRTFAYSDQQAAVWYAPAGVERGLITGIDDLGYASGTIGTANAFTPVHLNQGQRNLLYQYFTNINPLVYFPGQGFLVWGQKTAAGAASSMDRINVSRLVMYISRAFAQYSLPFVFQPNTQITRDNIASVFNSFLSIILAQQGLYDFLVVCDASNNPASIVQQNMLYVDVAIQPVIAAEFIYIPIIVVNTAATLSASGAVAAVGNTSVP
jgi:hypothetical protein